MPLVLNVDYAEKEEAKAKGARWNAELKTWYAPNRKSYPAFSKWIFESFSSGLIVLDSYKVVEADMYCPACDSPTVVVALSFDNYMTFAEPASNVPLPTSVKSNGFSDIVECSDNLVPFSDLRDYPLGLSEHLSTTYNIRGAEVDDNYKSRLTNHCTGCDAPILDEVLFDSEGPFEVGADPNDFECEEHALSSDFIIPNWYE